MMAEDFDAANALIGHRVLSEWVVASRNRRGPGPEFEPLAVTLRIEGVAESWTCHNGDLTYKITGIPGEFKPSALIDLGPFDYGDAS